MSISCLCPDTEVRDPIPTGPLICGCCGKPLVITCPGECGEDHIRAAFVSAGTKPVFSGTNDVDRGAKPPAQWVCQRCRGTIPKKPGRIPKSCDACLTPKEREQRAAKTLENERARASRSQAA